MSNFFKVYVLGLVFVVASTAPASAALLIGGWLWLQGLVLTVLGLVIPPARPVARWCFAGTDLCLKPIMWAFHVYDQMAFSDSQFSANFRSSEAATATDTEAHEVA